MDKKKLFSCFIYLFIISLSFIFLLSAVYLQEGKNIDLSKNIEKLESDIYQAKLSETIKDTPIVETTKEKKAVEPKKEGLLWRDPKTSLYMITLGEINGVEENGVFTIFDGGKIVGKGKIETVFEKLSAVEIADIEKINLKGSYYKISLND